MTRAPRHARVRAQAKLNLFLRVGGRDDTGYHDLLTLFQRIELADEIVVRAGGGRARLECSGPAMPPQGLGPEQDNLAWRAATAYIERAGWPDGFSVDIVKHIPVGGGLGGGSADAAGVLRALDALSPSPLGQDALLELARQLGADVPFLCTDLPMAVAGGRGDRILPDALGVTSLPERPVVLLLPPFAVSTADAYRWLDADPPASGLPAPPVAATDWDAVHNLCERLGNDFEPVVEARHPEIRTCRERLRTAGARIARMSGSGSTVFGLFDAPPPALDGLPARVVQLATRTSARVVQVQVRE